MKKVNFLVLLLTLAIISCDKEELVEANLQSDAEQFISNTGNSDKEGEIVESEDVEIALHMSFDENISEEDALATFERATADYLASQPQEAWVNKFRYRITTKTSSTNNYGTDAPVYSKVKFYTNRGNFQYTKRLDNPNKNDFKEGKTDYFLLEVTTNYPPCWIRLVPNGSLVKLQGTDGWGLTKLVIDMTESMQLGGADASGHISMTDYPNVLLDNISSNYWDEYVITGKNGFYGSMTLQENCD
ncbi:MAG: hypothetical protein HRT68_03120 [Flavobacteriaceae bacterium]|nr:hypothetical protein [Flavobacteriaceae bacterium]